LDLQGLFKQFEPRTDANLLVGIDTMDDAAVYRLDDHTALVVTADFITPPTSDPYWYGAIAAANSISDVYAMGGRAVTAINLCMFPDQGIDVESLGRVLKGGLDKIHEAGALLVGGHTVRDEELKYGLSVNGIVHPKKFTPNAGARAGDKMILTKPIGTGVHVTASKRGILADEKFDPVVRAMATLNKVACETMMEFDCRGATDITGFGLSGHALGMARASKVGIRFYYNEIPRFPETLDLIADGVKTGVTASNAKLAAPSVKFNADFSEDEKTLFWDPQTSGGLFIAIRAKDADALLAKLHERGVKDARIVGDVFAAETPHLEVVK
jgi:selenide, water dikinase